MKRSMLVLVAAALIGCATARPILYANPKYNEVGRDGAQRDIADCEQLAKNAGAGAAGGAVGGAIWGSPGTGAAAGAAGGAVGGLLWALFGSWASPPQPSEPYKNYVNQCLTDRGYQLAGWK